jgi:hypothetical protein
LTNFGIKQDQASGEYDPRYAPIPPKKQESSDGPAIASLVLGLVGLGIACVPVVGVLLGLIGIALGMKGKESSRNPGIATAGIVLNVICLLLSLAVTLLFLVGGCASGGSAGSYPSGST